MKEFIEDILKKDYQDKAQFIYNNSPLLQYLDFKMGAVYGNSKTRRSLGNLYAIYSLLFFYIEDFYCKKETYREFGGYNYNKLFSFCRDLYGGNKLQNHPLNSRVNGEFQNKFNANKDIIVINDGKYALHIDFLYVKNKDISKTALKIIKKYIALLKKKDEQLIRDINALKKLKSINEQKLKIDLMLNEKSEARIFEIVSFAILKNHYKGIKIFIGYEREKLKEEYLTLYKTGRTNANDGGIDFVMRPIGRFFQVTEVDNYDKYTLDIDKVLHFPITFVIKTNKDKQIVKSELIKHIKEKSGGMKMIEYRYLNAIEEIITINELKEWLYDLSLQDINALLSDIEKYYKVEMNLI
ncbi:MAG: restriction endonuclease [Elusimicrobiota bacterium]|jgi:hypothetical protein|nr:restriction endonuclease [Elusimicrobiota bacterium]